MSKKILAALLIALISLFSFTSCKQAENKTTSSPGGTNASEQADSADEKDSGKSDKKDSADSSDSQDSKNSESSQSSEKDSSKESEQKWTSQKDGTVIKGSVTADVVGYGKSTTEDGVELIEQLIKSGLKNAKIISSEKSDSEVHYVVSGQKIGEKQTKFIDFRFVIEKSKGYLITLTAENQADLDTDISYITSNLSDLAK